MIAKLVAISPDVFALLWSLRQPGEDDEDAVLRRILTAYRVGGEQSPERRGGFVDSRHGVVFPPGFEIFRIYRGEHYSAVAKAGKWHLKGTGAFNSLNQLSRAIGAKTENAWQNWFFLEEEKRRWPIDKRRAGRGPKHESNYTRSHMEGVATWLEDVHAVLRSFGRPAGLSEIYDAVRDRREQSRRALPPSFEAIVRRTLEEQSSDSESFKGHDDLFCMAVGKGAGVWGLRQSVP
jgi:hypothetical protein